MKNREIKFRAWDKELNKFYEPTHKAHKGELFELMLGLSGDLLAHTLNGINHETMFPDRFEVTQFTGLYDKNYNEIYEGDIMCWDKYQNTKNHVMWVVEINPLKAIKSWSSTGEEDAIVIGNIYENPELLK